MSEQQVNQLLAALAAQTKALNEQTAAITRLAESYEELSSDLAGDVEVTTLNDSQPQYLSTRPRG
ncbi:hypothetical protein SFA32_12360 [Buttiauxella sp. HR94]|nr:hypothetical protein SFA32_12360 [Buttiauxella sp. HR94]